MGKRVKMAINVHYRVYNTHTHTRSVSQLSIDANLKRIVPTVFQQREQLKTKSIKPSILSYTYV